MSENILLKGDLILKDRILRDAYVLCREGRIEAVGSTLPETTARLIDFSGHFIAPGFVDIHVHGAAGADYMDGTVDAVLTANRAHAAHGTTSIFPTTTTGTFEQLNAMIAASEEVRRSWRPGDGARIGGIHFYGPYFARDKVGCHPKEGRRNPLREEYEYFLSKDIVRIATCAAELPGAVEFYDFARQHGCLVTCGHSNACWEELEQAFAHGMRHVDHFWCAMSSVSSLRGRFGTPMRAGMEQFVLMNKGMSTELIADGEHLSDELLRFGYAMIGPERTCLVTDSNRALDAPPGRYRFGPAGDGTWVVSDGRTVRGEDGNLASSMCGMDTMVRNMARAVVMDTEKDLPAVLRMATLTPAELSGTAGSIGSIDPGKQADFVVLSPALELREVFIAGQPLRRAAFGSPSSGPHVPPPLNAE